MVFTGKLFETRYASCKIATIDREDVAKVEKYWKTTVPQTPWELFLCYLFAIASVHTGWQMSVLIFEEVRKFILQNPQLQLPARKLSRLLRSDKVHCGCYNTRVRAICEMHEKFWRESSLWWPSRFDSLVDARDFIASSVYGLGLAKSSFAIELIDSTAGDVMCIDTHAMTLYRYDRKFTLNYDRYSQIEQDFIRRCRKHELSPTIVRHVLFNEIHGQPDTRNWSYVLEKREDCPQIIKTSRGLKCA